MFFYCLNIPIATFYGKLFKKKNLLSCHLPVVQTINPFIRPCSHPYKEKKVLGDRGTKSNDMRPSAKQETNLKTKTQRHREKQEALGVGDAMTETKLETKRQMHKEEE